MNYISGCALSAIALGIFLMPLSANAACTCPNGYSTTLGSPLICTKMTVERKTVNAACNIGYVLEKNWSGNRDACNSAVGFGGSGKATVPDVPPPFQSGWTLDVKKGLDKWWKNESKTLTTSCLAP